MSGTPEHSAERSPKLCPKCRGTMYAGFVAEHGGEKSAALVRWHFGDPDPAIEAGSNPADPDLPLELFECGLVVAAFRCEACGFVELYAR
jgi:predicted nucleic-acid-binding Zn-ribbon protein